VPDAGGGRSAFFPCWLSMTSALVSTNHHA
jgi:hypothetical protein